MPGRSSARPGCTRITFSFLKYFLGLGIMEITTNNRKPAEETWCNKSCPPCMFCIFRRSSCWSGFWLSKCGAFEVELPTFWGPNNYGVRGSPRKSVSDFSQWLGLQVSHGIVLSLTFRHLEVEMDDPFVLFGLLDKKRRRLGSVGLHNDQLLEKFLRMTGGSSLSLRMSKMDGSTAFCSQMQHFHHIRNATIGLKRSVN